MYLFIETILFNLSKVSNLKINIIVICSDIQLLWLINDDMINEMNYLKNVHLATLKYCDEDRLPTTKIYKKVT